MMSSRRFLSEFEPEPTSTVTAPKKSLLGSRVSAEDQDRLRQLTEEINAKHKEALAHFERHDSTHGAFLARLESLKERLIKRQKELHVEGWNTAKSEGKSDNDARKQARAHSQGAHLPEGWATEYEKEQEGFHTWAASSGVTAKKHGARKLKGMIKGLNVIKKIILNHYEAQWASVHEGEAHEFVKKSREAGALILERNAIRAKYRTHEKKEKKDKKDKKKKKKHHRKPKAAPDGGAESTVTSTGRRAHY